MLMKFYFNALLFLIFLFLFENKAYPLSENQITQLCQKESRRTTCIKKLRLKKSNLLKGNRIEIPVIPFKK